MRIIAGEARGRKLRAPEGKHTRPSSDRVKEALFGSIQFDLPGAVVLDLFSGSGALGLEALSRGASLAFCNDNDARSVDCIAENAHALGLDARLRLSKMNYDVLLRDLAAKGEKLDFVFLDPPYASQYAQKALCLLAEGGLLAEGARIFWEHDVLAKPDPVEMQTLGFAIRSSRKYGKTILTVLQRSGA